MRRIKIFNVFLSSTFADMQTERDHLRKKVFSVLDAELMKEGARLNVIDLRGSEKSGAGDQNLRVLYMCLEAVDSCRPRFVGLLGDRYGWIPYLADEGDPGYDPAIHKSALDVVKHIDMDRNIHMVKMEMKGKSATHLEMHYALSPNNMGVETPKPVRVEDCFFYERVIRNREAMSEANVSVFEDQRERQLLLKADISQRMKVEAPGHYNRYEAQWDPHEGRISASSLDALCALMLQQLRASVARELLEAGEDPEAEKETALFLLEKLERHIQQRPELARVQQLLHDEAEAVLLLQGVAGSGKSTLMAQLADWLEPVVQQGHGRVLFHAAGMDPKSRTEWGLLSHWIRLLEDSNDGAVPAPGILNADTENALSRTIANITALPRGEKAVHQLRERFAALLTRAAAKQKVYLLLDSVDSMENTHAARHFVWMPRTLPQGVCLVASTLPDMARFPDTFERAVTDVAEDAEGDGRSPGVIQPQTIEIHGMTRLTLQKTLEEMALFQFGKSWNNQILQLSVNKCLAAGGLPLYAQILVGHLMTMTYEDFRSVGFGDAAHGKWMRAQLEAMPETIDALYAIVFGRIRQMDAALCDAMDALLGTVAVTRRGLDQQTLVAAVADCTGDMLEDADLLSVQGLLRGHLRTAQQGWWEYEHQQVRRHLLQKETGISQEKQKQYHASLIHVAVAGGEDVQYGAYFCSEFLWHAWLADLPEMAAAWLGTLPVSIETDAQQTLIDMLTEAETETETETETEAEAETETIRQTSAILWLERTMTGLLHTPGFRRGASFFARCLFDSDRMQRVSYSTQIRIAEAVTALWERYQPEDPEQQEWKEENTATLYRELGVLYESFDDREKAIDWLTRAEVINHQRYEAQPTHPDRMMQYALACNGLGNYLSSGGEIRLAEPLYLKAEAIFGQLREATPESLDLLLHHVGCCFVLGDLNIKAWDKKAALQWYQRAEVLCLPLLAEEPRNPMRMALYADICTGMGKAHVDLYDRKPYVVWHEKAIELRRQLHQMDPGNVLNQRRYAAALCALGASHAEVDMVEKNDDAFDPDFVFVSKGEGAWAEQCFLKAEALLRSLIVRDPENPAILNEYQYTCKLLGDLYAGNHRSEDAEPWLFKAVEAQRVMHEAHKDNATYARQYADTCHEFALFHQSRGDERKTAEWFWKEALARQLLCRMHPENLEGWEAYQALCQELADQFENTEPKSAEAWYLKAEAVSRSLLALEPEEKERWWNHCFRCRRLGMLFEEQDKLDKAVDWYQKAEARCRAMGEKGMGHEADHVSICLDLGKLHQKHERSEGAETWLLEAEKLIRRRLEADPENVFVMRQHAEACLALRLFFAWQGERAQEEIWLLKAESLYLRAFGQQQGEENAILGLRLADYARVCCELGHFHLAGGDRENAGEWYEKARFCSSQLYEDEIMGEDYVALHAEVCQALGDFHAAAGEWRQAEEWHVLAEKLKAECHGAYSE